MNIFTKKINLIVSLTALVISSTTLVAHAEDGQAVEATVKSCGEIVTYNKPPQTKSIYHAWINTIDGETVSTKAKRFVLTPGVHKIKLVENIVDPRFTRRRGEMMNAKVFELNVEPGKKYALGAQYVRKNRNKLKTGEYWEPVVWKVSEADADCK